ncbi:MAG: GFA family protein [Acidimicrobiales bacterium]
MASAAPYRLTVATSGMASGGCHCGGVRYRVDGDLRPVIDCHCEPCRRITGHHMAASACASTAIVLETGDTLTWYRSAPTTRYGFCSTCGSTLFWRVDDDPGHVSIAAGTIDQPSGLETVSAQFLAEHGDYHSPQPVPQQWPGDQT